MKNLVERYKKLKKQASGFMKKGLIAEYLKILQELHHLEMQLERSVVLN